MTKALVIGAGPAGLMAAEEMARAGLLVTVADAMPSVGRKFLMAGKSGLNLTNARGEVQQAYRPTQPLDRMIKAFGPDAIWTWAEGLGQSLFVGSSGHVFPHAMKASPLLRAWLARLTDLGVEVRPRMRWTGPLGRAAQDWSFADGTVLHADRVVLALGGASWRRLGSDGLWAEAFKAAAVPLTPFRGSNLGFGVDWTDHMAPVFGKPVKPVRLIAGEIAKKGEFIITKQGVEGSGIYALSHVLQRGAALKVDLLPDLSNVEVTDRLARPRGKQTVTSFLRKTFRFDSAKLALINELARGQTLAALPLKALPLPLKGPQPMDEAISTAGGVAWDGLDDGLMLKDCPGVYCAGEMLDWDAPTGGYLLTACLATGLWAGRSAGGLAPNANKD
ncbi:MAG: TIGR03862 family flavoprotein [Paracoccaceae bacterium]